MLKRPEDVEAICATCAKQRGWLAVPFAVGVWEGECDDCGELRDCTAPRDYRKGKDNPLGR